MGNSRFLGSVCEGYPWVISVCMDCWTQPSSRLLPTPPFVPCPPVITTLVMGIGTKEGGTRGRGLARGIDPMRIVRKFKIGSIFQSSRERACGMVFLCAEKGGGGGMRHRDKKQLYRFYSFEIFLYLLLRDSKVSERGGVSCT